MRAIANMAVAPLAIGFVLMFRSCEEFGYKVGGKDMPALVNSVQIQNAAARGKSMKQYVDYSYMPPGADYLYHGGGYLPLGEIVEMTDNNGTNMVMITYKKGEPKTSKLKQTRSSVALTISTVLLVIGLIWGILAYRALDPS